MKLLKLNIPECINTFPKRVQYKSTNFVLINFDLIHDKS